MIKQTYLSTAMLKARLHLGYTQRKMASLLGISPSGLNRYEKGNRQPPTKIINQVKELLGGTKDDKLAELMTQLHTKNP